MPSMFLHLRHFVDWSCGLAVYGLWAGCGFTIRLTHTLRVSFYAWVKTYGFVDSLYHFSTQVLPTQNMFFSSVNGQFYPPSTTPIKTTAYLKKG